MASTIQGPIIKFSISSADLAGPLRQAFGDVQNQTRSATQTIASQWQQMAAKIRADIATEALGTKNVVTQREALTGILSKQISLLQNKNDLTTKELSSLKAMTLEYERQADAQARGSKIGITAGTSEALGRVGAGLGSAASLFGSAGAGPLAAGFTAIAQVAQVLSGALGKVGAMGEEAAAKTGTLEKSLGGVSVAAQGLSAAEKPIEGIGAASVGAETEVGLFSSGIVSAGVAVGGFVAALAGLTLAGGLVTKGLAEQNEGFENVAAATGLTSQEVQTYNEIAKQMGLNSDTITGALARLQTQLGQYIVSGKDAGSGTAHFVDVAKQLGVQLTDTAGTLRPAGQIIADFGEALNKIPDISTRGAVGADAFGRSWREIAPLFLRTNVDLKAMTSAIQASGLIIDSDMSAKLDSGKEKLNQFGLIWDSTWMRVKEDVASVFMGTFLDQIDAAKSALGELHAQNQSDIDKIKANAGTIFAGAPQVTFASPDATALKQFQQAQAGGAIQLEIQQKQQQANDLAKQAEESRLSVVTGITNTYGAQALALQNQIEALKTILSIEQFREATNAKISAEIAAGNVGGHPTISDAMKAQLAAQQFATRSNPSSYIDQSTMPSFALALPGTNSEQSTAAIASINSVATEASAEFNKLKDSINQDYTATFESGTQKILANLATLENQLNVYAAGDVARAQEVANLKVEAEATAQAQILQLQDDANKQALEKAENEAGQLFDALLTGNTKKISTEFEKVFEQIATAPIKKLFEVSMAAALKPLDDSLANAVKPYVTSISNWILGKKASPNPFDLNNPNNPYATPGGALASIAAAAGQNGNVVNSGSDPNNLLILNLKRSLGLGGRGTGGSVPGGTAPVFQISDATMYVQTLSITASTVNLTSAGGIAHPQSPVPGSMDGDHTPAPDWLAGGFMGSGADSFSAMNLMPSLTDPNSGLTLAGSISALTPAVTTLTANLQKSVAQMSATNSTSSQADIGQLSGEDYQKYGNAAQPIGGGGANPNATGGLNSMAGIMQAAGGAMMLYEASRHGGVGGAIVGGVGGAELGSTIGKTIANILGSTGPMGMLLGAGIGALAGVVTGLFGHKDRTAAFDAAIKTAGYNEQYHAPPPETFSFAEGSTFAQTMQSTFSQAGTAFAKVALPMGTPFWMNAILGPLSTKNINGAPSQAQLYNNLNNGLPFFGAPTYGLGSQTLMPSITQGNLPPGTHQSSINFGPPSYGLVGPQTLMPPITEANLPPGNRQSTINLTLPPSLTQSGGALLGLLVQGMLPHIQQGLGRAYASTSSSMGVRARRAVNLP